MECEKCESGFFMLEGTNICHEDCPTGFEKDGQACVFSESIEITFDVTVNDHISHGFSLIAEELRPSETNPKIFSNRGMYFDGSNYLELDKLTLNHSFTISMWIRVLDNGNIFSISKDLRDEQHAENYLNIKA